MTKPWYLVRMSIRVVVKNRVLEWSINEVGVLHEAEVSPGKAALEAPRVLNLNNNKHFYGPYGENIVFVANDWHTALLPCYLKSIYQSQGIYKNAKVVFCMHNMAYQGRFAFLDFSLLNLPSQFKSSFDFIDGYDKLVKGRKINCMKAGIIESDIVLTVSPYYAKEISSNEAKGSEKSSRRDF